MGRPYAEVIGDPIAHSKSPLIHNFWLGKLGIDAEYRACHVKPDELKDYLTRRRGDAEWRGCNVTMPHKVAVGEFLEALSAQAYLVGAVNCITPLDARLIGDNTDVDGVREPLSLTSNRIEEYANHVATYVQIVGAGGAARAAAVAVAEKFDFEFYNRDVAKAKRLAQDFGLPEWFGCELDCLGPIRNPGEEPAEQRYSTIVLNASAMGMRGNPPVPINLNTYHSDTIVFDMVYDPIETPLLREARRLGFRTIDGLAMLIAQAATAFEKFFGQSAPREHDAELRALLTA